MGVDKVDLQALFTLSYGLYIVTGASEGRLNGQIANALMQVTADPICVVVALHKDNLTTELVEKNKAFGVSVLEEDTPMPFIGTFGFKCGRDINKMTQCQYKIGETGAPLVLDHALAVIEAKVIDIIPVYTHKLFVAEVVLAETIKSGTPLTYANYRLIKGGKSPKNAPTFVFNKA
ncbi:MULTISPECIES: flavin reductase family protein [Acetomicrobium]|jgi:flavin reductase (DIM6/NTAB) family NADH-FMN oxidoreductase RutF|uniref:Rubredoxin family protein n=1 Tax=Acetomicrobium hydrogeniformans ATCC BAA-1850 TaxID=592015 RepID=A0A0T5X983_9BACT|nr:MULTISPECIES: flavin reductase family protein [Acetomicrobium]KRT34938.1 rubredoxin family protein [Acetomicrobium hydrogeniformans ATCC BAA-1850]